ncbi:MAG: ornithine carbamoyltransferase [Selenomonadaceae bacterium]|nr:ornithine carbamoyltransferase [Selenomonadaceae bacterium]MBQ7629864.1 ornithine carbamoyltransferase [Selenomonadaceae bacterium]
MAKDNGDFISLHDLTPAQVEYLLDFALDLKTTYKSSGFTPDFLKGQTLGMIFEKSSTRTRVSFEVGMYQLGGSALFLSSKDLQLGRGEPIKDTARVLSRYLNGIMIRTFGHERIVEFAKYATIPVINGLSDLLHPCQVLTDLLTIREFKGKMFSGLKMAYVGDGNNMANSYLYGAAKVGMALTVATPKSHKPNAKVLRTSAVDAKRTGAELNWTEDPIEAVKDADIVATDTWASMGQEAEHDARKKIFAPYQVNAELLSHANKNAIVLHCLPAYRGEEITEDVFEDNAKYIFEEAENRLHAQKAILATLMM